MRIVQLLSCLFIFSVTAVRAQEDPVVFRNIANDILLNGKAYQNLRVLCKNIGPRLPGTPQQVKAEQETFRMMKQMGADTVYYQECMVPHWVRGEKEIANITGADGKKISLDICALGNSVGTGPNGIRAELVEVSSWKQLDDLGEKGIKGKIVFFNVRFNPIFIEPWRGYVETTVFRWEGPSRAAKYGAVGTMIRSLASNTDDRPHTGGMKYNDSLPKIPCIAISAVDGDFIADELRKRKTLPLYFRTTCNTLPKVVGHNVIGELRGSTSPDEIITVGGHLDSWDLAEGAHDDGAGCVQSMELIRVYKRLGIVPKHTIRVVMFADEENGGAGSEKYAELAKASKQKMFFALESDDGGFVPRGFRFSLEEEKIDRLRKYLPLFTPYGVYKFESGDAGADIENLKPLGAVIAGLYPDPQRYFDVHHAKSDTFENVNKRELELGAISMAQLVYLVDKYGL